MSKYNIGVQAIRKLTENELDKFIRGGVKVINGKYARIKKNGIASKFSEYVKDFDELSSRFYGTSKNFSSSVKGKTLEEKKLVAYAINNLSQIQETPALNKKEFKQEIIDNFITDPEFTEDLFNYMTNDELIENVRDNYDVLYDVLGSSRVSQLSNEYGGDTYEFYKESINQAMYIMNEYYDPAEIEKIVEGWNFQNVGI